MQKQATPPAAETLPKSTSANLEEAITKLAIAVTALAEVITERRPTSQSRKKLARGDLLLIE
jgi:hypothetical protein